PSGHAICTQDKERKSIKFSSYELEPSGLFGRAGVILCRFYTYERDLDFSHVPELKKGEAERKRTSGNELTSVSFDFAGVGRWPMAFMFTPATLPKDKANRLFSCPVGLNNKHFDEVLTALKARYGESSSKSISQFKTRIGAEFENLTLPWANGVSTIIVERYAD